MHSVKTGHDELMHERRNLQQRIDNLENENGNLTQSMNDYTAQVQEKESMLEEIRSRVTAIAELFEKKPIKQRYSFEVLCDFVHDKAKRLFSKYENAIKDKKNHERTGRTHSPHGAVVDTQTREAIHLL